MTETDIQSKIRIALSEFGIVLRLNVGQFVTQDGRYITSGLPPGTPDLLFIGTGFVAFIEVKTPKGRLRPEQEQFLIQLHELHIRAGVARCVEDAMKIINAPQ